MGVMGNGQKSMGNVIPRSLWDHPLQRGKVRAYPPLADFTRCRNEGRKEKRSQSISPAGGGGAKRRGWTIGKRQSAIGKNDK